MTELFHGFPWLWIDSCLEGFNRKKKELCGIDYGTVRQDVVHYNS
jgi:hypothetical protein